MDGRIDIKTRGNRRGDDGGVNEATEDTEGILVDATADRGRGNGRGEIIIVVIAAELIQPVQPVQPVQPEQPVAGCTCRRIKSNLYSSITVF